MPSTLSHIAGATLAALLVATPALAGPSPISEPVSTGRTTEAAGVQVAGRVVVSTQNRGRGSKASNPRARAIFNRIRRESQEDE